MRGHVRRRGESGSFEYIVDIGLAAVHGLQQAHLGRASALDELPRGRRYLA